MTYDTEYMLEEFRARQPEYFDSDGCAYRSVWLHAAAEDMLKLINALEQEVKLLEEKAERL